jgi:hypothetical protein
VHAAAERLLPSLSTEQQAKAASILPGLMRTGSGIAVTGAVHDNGNRRTDKR